MAANTYTITTQLNSYDYEIGTGLCRSYFLDNYYIDYVYTGTAKLASHDTRYFAHKIWNPFMDDDLSYVTSDNNGRNAQANTKYHSDNLTNRQTYLQNDCNYLLNHDTIIAAKVMQVYRCLHAYPLIYDSIKRLQARTETIKTVKATLVNSINAA